VYIVAKFQYPHERKAFYTYDGSSNPAREAQEFLDNCSPSEDWTLFGPYLAEFEGEASTWGAQNCRVTVDVTSATGDVHHDELDPDIDAVFLTLSAIDKFVVPYYTSVFGVERAAEIRRTYVAHPTVWVHVLDSAWTPRGGKT